MKASWAIAYVVLLSACHSAKESASVPATALGASAPTLVYRTKTDHRDHVPVLLSDDRRTIISYPHPNDLRAANGLTLPSELSKGYLLDNRGIGPNVAFLSISYADYAALDRMPSLEKLAALIVDRDPLLELCDCGPRGGYADVVQELDALIKQDALLSRCKRLK